MTHEVREFTLADDYDTALHIVESIRRKAQAQHNQRHEDRDSDNDDDDDDDDAQVGMSSDEVDEDDDDLSDGGDNNDNNNSNFGNASKPKRWRRPDTLVGSPQAASPQPPSSERLKSHRALEALRIEPQVELHRIASGRNLRLKHVSQTSKGALSPHALTPRAPSGRRPTERPSSWSSSSSSSSLSRHFDAARVNSYRPHTHRSISTGGSSPLTNAVARSRTAAASVGAMIHEVKANARDANNKLETWTENSPVRQQVSRAPLAQNRRCSFTISELALKEMGFSRSSPPGPETAPIHEDKQFVADPFARFRAQQIEMSALKRDTQKQEQEKGKAKEEEEEEEEKAVYQFALWKKAGRSRQLPDAISTRSKPPSPLQQQQQQQQQQQDEHAISAAASLPPDAISWGRPIQRQEHRTPNAMFSDLRVDSIAFSPEAFRSEGEKCTSESPALRLPRSRSPTIGGSRSFRRAADSPSFTPIGPEH